MGKFKFKGLMAKLILLCLIPTVGLLILTTMMMLQTSDLNRELSYSSERNAPLIQLTSNLKTSLSSIEIAFLTIAQNDADAFSKDDIQTIAKSYVEYVKNSRLYGLMERSDKEKELYKIVEENFNNSKELIDLVISQSNSIDFSKKSDKEAFLKRVRMAVNPISSSIQTILTALDQIDLNRNQEIEAWTQEAEQDSQRRTLVSGLLVTLIIVTIVIYGNVQIRAIYRQLSQTKEELTRSGFEVTQASEVITQTANDLSNRSVSSSASIEQSVASMEELVALVTANTQNSKKAAAMSQQGLKTAQMSSKMIFELIETMRTISVDSKKIESMVEVIDDIAFQTNLLALNAAVEAARAGEQGKGFAVVADAVRNLAQNSANSAREITQLMQSTSRNVATGTQSADRSATALKDIVGAIEDLVRINEDISTAIQEQSRSTQQINQALQTLDIATQSNAKSSQDLAESCDLITELNQSLENSIASLDEFVEGHGRAA